MEESNNTLKTYDGQIKKFLDDFMLDMYKGNDHIIARKYFNDLFSKLIPRYFCICEHESNEAEVDK